MLQPRRYCRDGNELPPTLRRSCQEAQDTFTKARESAVQVYGETEQADRAAFTALKEKFEKRGDHWIASAIPETDRDRSARPGWESARFSPEADTDGGSAAPLPDR
jgi:ChaB